MPLLVYDVYLFLSVEGITFPLSSEKPTRLQCFASEAPQAVRRTTEMEGLFLGLVPSRLAEVLVSWGLLPVCLPIAVSLGSFLPDPNFVTRLYPVLAYLRPEALDDPINLLF